MDYINEPISDLSSPRKSGNHTSTSTKFWIPIAYSQLLPQWIIKNVDCRVNIDHSYHFHEKYARELRTPPVRPIMATGRPIIISAGWLEAGKKRRPLSLERKKKPSISPTEIRLSPESEKTTSLKSYPLVSANIRPHFHHLLALWWGKDHPMNGCWKKKKKQNHSSRNDLYEKWTRS